MSSLAADLESLAEIGRDGGGISRFAFTPELGAASRWLLDRFAELDMRGFVDTAGNVHGVWEVGEGKAVMTGSHLDTVPRGGRYDGALGVLAGLEAVRILRRRRVEPARPVRVVSFNDEEGARFRTSLFGSRAFIGDLDLDGWRARAIPEAMREAGFEFERLAEARGVDDVAVYLELHIEQGPVLEQSGADIGVVTSVTGLVGLRALFLGSANHAGTTPMAARRDALAGAARAVLALRDEARSRADMTANVGQIRVEPGGANVVPALAEISIDLRSPTAAGFARAEALAGETLARIADEEKLGLEVEVVHRKEPTPLDERVQSLIELAAADEGASCLRLPSGAGHDAMMLARRVPAGMLFVPSRGGISHSAEEFTPLEQCELGARVLARAIELAAAQTPGGAAAP